MIYRGQKAICTFRPPDRPESVRVVWELTNACNLSCAHCCNDARLGGAPPLEARLLALPRVMAEAGVAEVYLSGGEPLMVANLPVLLERFLETGIRPAFASNGVLVTRRLHELPAGVPLLISLDWPEAELHDRFRGQRGSHAQVMSAIDALAERGHPFHLSTVLHEGFRHEPAATDRLADMASRRGATAIVFSRQVGVGRARHAVNPSRALIERIAGLARQYGERLWVAYPRLSPLLEVDHALGACHGAQGLLHITTAGDVGPCSFAVKMVPGSCFGNINSDSFASIAKRAVDCAFMQRLDRWRADLEDECSRCPHAAGCGRGCPLFGRPGPFEGLDSECPLAKPS